MLDQLEQTHATLVDIEDAFSDALHGADPLDDHERALLSTLPFLALIVGLGVVAVAVMFAAWPGRQQAAPQRQSAATSGGGVAAPGWFDDAKREMRR